MSFFKDNPIRDEDYIKWVKSLPCVITGVEPAGDAHHIIGVGDGGMGTKACDLLVFPVTRAAHQPFHRLDLNPELREEQWKHVAKTLQLAMKEGIKVS